MSDSQRMEFTAFSNLSPISIRTCRPSQLNHTVCLQMLQGDVPITETDQDLTPVNGHVANTIRKSLEKHRRSQTVAAVRQPAVPPLHGANKIFQCSFYAKEFSFYNPVEVTYGRNKTNIGTLKNFQGGSLSTGGHPLGV